MNDAPAPAVRVGPIHYQILCAAGLLAMFLAQFYQGDFWGCLLIGCVGLLGLVSSWRVAPLLVLLVVAGTQWYFHWQRYRSVQVDEPYTLLNLRDLGLAIGLITYVATHYRLQSLYASILPFDRRQRELQQRQRGRRRWREFVAVQQKRAGRLLTPQEIARFVLTLPLAALAGQALWLVIARPWTATVFHDRAHRLITLTWLLIMGLLIVGTILAHWRRRSAFGGNRAAAAVYLQDVLWRESRREQRRTFRWLAWRRLHERVDKNESA
jgi:hypothetical protein